MNNYMVNSYCQIEPSYMDYMSYCQYQKMLTIQGTMAVIENYFSFNNLNNDIYIRSAMGRDGWVPLDVICSLNRIKATNLSKEILENALLNLYSDVIEVQEKDEEVFLRNKNWREIEKYLNDMNTMKYDKMRLIQNEYICSRMKIIPKRNMRPMRSRMKKIKKD